MAGGAEPDAGAANKRSAGIMPQTKGTNNTATASNLVAFIMAISFLNEYRAGTKNRQDNFYERPPIVMTLLGCCQHVFLGPGGNCCREYMEIDLAC